VVPENCISAQPLIIGSKDDVALVESFFHPTTGKEQGENMMACRGASQ